ncbi:MAG: hypothetical protein RLZZ397_954 [Pseudomonadota bacterium]|jgi:uncharacterized protein YbaR (Trm112 family)
MDTKLLELLVCPLTKGRLVWKRELNELWSQGAGLAFPVRDGIPLLLEGEARELSEVEMNELRALATV